MTKENADVRPSDQHTIFQFNIRFPSFCDRVRFPVHWLDQKQKDCHQALYERRLPGKLHLLLTCHSYQSHLLNRGERVGQSEVANSDIHDTNRPALDPEKEGGICLFQTLLTGRSVFHCLNCKAILLVGVERGIYHDQRI